MENCVIVRRFNSFIFFWTGGGFLMEYPNACLFTQRGAGKEVKRIKYPFSLEVIKDYGLETEELVYKT